jgi:hypothetical protein
MFRPASVELAGSRSVGRNDACWLIKVTGNRTTTGGTPQLARNLKLSKRMRVPTMIFKGDER